MRNTLKKMAELTYAELTQDRESTRLPHTHKFTSLKNVVISAPHKIDNEYIFKPKCNCRRKSMQEKEPIMIVWCKFKVPSLRITVWHHSASLAMLNSYRRDRIFNPQLKAIKNTNTVWDIFCPYLCCIRKCNVAEPILHTKIWYLSVSALFFFFFFTYKNV